MKLPTLAQPHRATKPHVEGTTIPRPPGLVPAGVDCLDIPLQSDPETNEPVCFDDQTCMLVDESTGKALSANAYSAVMSKFELIHVERGHGPRRTDKQIRDASRTQGKAGKWVDDCSMFATYVDIMAEVASGRLKPGPGRKRIAIESSQALAYNNGTQVKATTAGIGFVKDKKTNQWRIKTFFPEAP